jgi:hypothetical protein
LVALQLLWNPKNQSLGPGPVGLVESSLHLHIISSWISQMVILFINRIGFGILLEHQIGPVRRPYLFGLDVAWAWRNNTWRTSSQIFYLVQTFLVSICSSLCWIRFEV